MDLSSDRILNDDSSGRWYSLVSVKTRLRAGQTGVRFPAVARIISLLQNVHTVPGAHAASNSFGNGVY